MKKILFVAAVLCLASSGKLSSRSEVSWVVFKFGEIDNVARGRSVISQQTLRLDVQLLYPVDRLFAFGEQDAIRAADMAFGVIDLFAKSRSCA